MKSKKCFKCLNTKSINLFYRHKEMADGHLNKCIECSKRDVRRDRKNNPMVQERDRIRYHLDPKRRRRIAKNSVKWRKENPDKYKAQTALNNAIRDGKIKRERCWCGKKAHAHHTDYSKPLDVKWLCPQHHQHEHHKNAR